MAYGKLQSMHVSRLPLEDFITYLLLAQETAHHYNFSNIQYAQPPVGDLQWVPPQPPLANRTTVNDSQTGVVYPQGTTRWGIERILFANAYVFGKGSVTALADDPPPSITESSPLPRSGSVH